MLKTCQAVDDPFRLTLFLDSQFLPLAFNKTRPPLIITGRTDLPYSFLPPKRSPSLTLLTIPHLRNLASDFEQLIKTPGTPSSISTPELTRILASEPTITGVVVKPSTSGLKSVINALIGLPKSLSKFWVGSVLIANLCLCIAGKSIYTGVEEVLFGLWLIFLE